MAVDELGMRGSLGWQTGNQVSISMAEEYYRQQREYHLAQQAAAFNALHTNKVQHAPESENTLLVLLTED